MVLGAPGTRSDPTSAARHPGGRVLHVIGRDLYDGYRGRLKPDPTTGTDEIPVSQPRPLEPGEQPSPDVTATANR